MTKLLIILLVLLVFWFFLRSRQSQVTSKVRPERRTTSSNTAHHAISLRTASNACTAAKEIVGKRFLSGDAPRIPLPDCDVMDCQCRFAHHKDRRTGKDRRNVFTASGHSVATGEFEQERRQGAERRDDDEFS